MIINFAPSKRLSIIFLLLFGYFFGSIPSGYLAGKWIKGIDLRQYGSGTVSGSMVWEHVAKWAVVPVGLLISLKAHFRPGLDCVWEWGSRRLCWRDLLPYWDTTGQFISISRAGVDSVLLGELFVLFPWEAGNSIGWIGDWQHFSKPNFPTFYSPLLPFFAQFLQDSPLFCGVL